MDEKIKRFLKDEAMVEAVFTALQASFLKQRGSKDVQYLAAKSLALELLDEAKKEIWRYNEENKEPKELNQVGL